ncbi:MAG: hypothetical protein RIQ64_343, partial [Actinomycetota bacterium]
EVLQLSLVSNTEKSFRTEFPL